MGWSVWKRRNASPPPRLSVCIITLNRAHELRGLLANVCSLAWEVVVLDGGSTDATAQLCESYPGVRFEVHPWDDHFARQKNRCFDLARGDWILDIDTDERVGPWLANDLPRLITSQRYDFYRLPMYWLTDLDPPLYVETPQHYPCHVPRLFRNVTDHRYLDEKPIHPRFADHVVRRMKKVRRRHLFHYCFARQDRASLQKKVDQYQERFPESDETNRKYYLWWEHRHRLRTPREPTPDWEQGPPS